LTFYSKQKKASHTSFLFTIIVDVIFRRPQIPKPSKMNEKANGLEFRNY